MLPFLRVVRALSLLVALAGAGHLHAADSAAVASVVANATVGMPLSGPSAGPALGAGFHLLEPGGLVVGATIRTILRQPVRIERTPFGGVAEPWRDDGLATHLTLTVDAGWRYESGPVTVAGGVAAGLMNMSQRRRIPSADDDGVIAQNAIAPAMALWATARYRIVGGLGVDANLRTDLLGHRSALGTNTATGSTFEAVIAEPRTVVSLGLSWTSPRPDRADTTVTYRLWGNLVASSWHPFRRGYFNEFNPGLGLHITKGQPDAYHTFLEVGAYQESLADLSVYAGYGWMWPIVGDWLTGGGLVGVIRGQEGTGGAILPAISPRLTAAVGPVAVTVLVIPVGIDTAVGLLVHVPLADL